MQTFLPYPDFIRSMHVLDRRRLNKQRIEAWQILQALTRPDYGWQNHPAVQQWRGSENYLRFYGVCACKVWLDIGGSDSANLLGRFRAFPVVREGSNAPAWMCSVSYHASHRSNLLRKDPAWYGQWGWTEGPDLPYVWPSKTPLRDIVREYATVFPWDYDFLEEDYAALAEGSAFEVTESAYEWATLIHSLQGVNRRTVPARKVDQNAVRQ
jgi:hypothetical protein